MPPAPTPTRRRARRRPAWPQQRLDRLASLAWAEVQRFFLPDSCVLAARVFLDVLADLGGPPAVAIAAGCQVHRPGGDTRVLLGSDPYGVAPCPRHADGSWGGHVVVGVADQWLVDLSISQASHPELGLPLAGTLVVPAGPAVLAGRAAVECTVRGGVRLTYRLDPADTSWTDGPDWQPSTAGQALRRVIGARWRGEPADYPPLMYLQLALTGRV